MGNVDKFDQMIGYTRIRSFGKKYWHPINSFLIDIIVHNSWVIYNSLHQIEVTSKEFRLMLAKELINEKKYRDRRPETSLFLHSVSLMHFPTKVDGEAKRCQCGGVICKSKTPYVQSQAHRRPFLSLSYNLMFWLCVLVVFF